MNRLGYDRMPYTPHPIGTNNTSSIPAAEQAGLSDNMGFKTQHAGKEQRQRVGVQVCQQQQLHRSSSRLDSEGMSVLEAEHKHAIGILTASSPAALAAAAAVSSKQHAGQGDRILRRGQSK